LVTVTTNAGNEEARFSLYPELEPEPEPELPDVVDADEELEELDVSTCWNPDQMPFAIG
jgi:hypothetical protein